MKQQTPKTFKELFANTGIEPTTNENGNIQYNFKATIKEKSKQETLEEAAKKHCLINNIPTDQMIVKNDRSCEFETPVTMFIKGAKWQQERSYSEEEVIKIVEKSRETGLTAEFLLLTEQFKKK
jgi:glutamate synthase domain-containing protein 1